MPNDPRPRDTRRRANARTDSAITSALPAPVTDAIGQVTARRTPLQIMLASTYWFHREAKRLSREARKMTGEEALHALEIASTFRKLAAQTAREAAPYIHRRAKDAPPPEGDQKLVIEIVRFADLPKEEQEQSE